MAEINVYLFDECDYVASPWALKETQEWHNKLTGAGYECDPEVVNIKTCGMWKETSGELEKGKVVTGDKIFGNLGYFAGTLCVYTSFDDEIKQLGDIDEPEIIASTEY
ncbi:MAG: hypothetical protein CVU99_02520 [Firmicutes bacterium HGW-Firmicutes-4]|nr:MAG: hypothetical protein CVU99_02520 [Firmicutes bacterium HGW-Firmicutes-4]